MLKRAYSLFEVKAIDDDERVIEGIATTPTPDRMDDIVESEGAEFKLPLPLLWQHNSRAPIGSVTRAKVTEEGIEIRAQLAKAEEPGTLRDRLDEAWQSLKIGLVRGLSIGFRAIETADIKGTFGIRFTKWEWLELSAVTIPANQEATVSVVRSFDRAASGTRVVRIPPGVSGGKSISTEDSRAMDINEQIKSLEATRAAKHARMVTIQEAVAKEGRTKDESEEEEFATLSDELEKIDKELADYRKLEKLNAAQAKPVEGNGTKAAADSRNPQLSVRTRGPDLEPGIRFARVAKCIGVAYRKHRDVATVAAEMYPNDTLVHRAAVAAGSTTDDAWAGALVGDESSVFADFVEFLRPATIVGRFGLDGVPNLRRVPFRTPLVGQTAGGTGYWVGEGAAKPLTRASFERRTLEELKVANIAVITEELMRQSSPSADMAVRNDLREALRERMDIDFIDPAKAAAAGISPASITNGITPIPSSGPTADDVRTDIQAIWNAFTAANVDPSTGVWIMQATTAMALSLMQNPLGQSEFPGVGLRGGTLFELPVIVSQYVPTGIVVLVNASDIYFADEGGIAVDVSREASLEMDDAPTGSSITPTATSVVSLWQTNSVGFRAERTLNWMRRRDVSVQVLSGVAWGSGGS